MKQRVSRTEMAYFALALAQHVQAGETIQEACREIGKITSNALRSALEAVSAALLQDDVQAHEAFARRPDVFPAPFCQAIRVGQLSGNLWQCLERYSLDQQCIANNVGSISRATLYPAVGLLLTLITCAILIVFIIRIN